MQIIKQFDPYIEIQNGDCRALRCKGNLKAQWKGANTDTALVFDLRYGSERGTHSKITGVLGLGEVMQILKLLGRCQDLKVKRSIYETVGIIMGYLNVIG